MVALPNQPQTVSLATFQKIQKLLQEANQRIRQLEQENQQLRAEKWQERNLRKKKDFKPAEKYTLLELQRQIESPNAHKDEEGFTRICYSTVAINTGMSDSTPKRKVDAIQAQWPDIPLETKTVTEYEGVKKIDRLYVKPKDNTNLIQAAINATLSEEHIRKQGGNKYTCQKCGSADVKIKRRLYCNCCGHETDLEDSYPNGKLKNSTGKSNLLSENDSTDGLSDESDTGETGRSNLLFDESEPDGTFFDETAQLDDVIQETELRQVDSELTVDSNNPPCMSSVATITDWLEKRRGTPRIIQATGLLKSEDKYISKSEAYEPDLAAYVAGKIGHIYGSWLRNADGKTSVLSFDCDTPEHNDQAQNYLLDLARAGGSAIYWQRQRERGHLEIYFDAPVDPEAARLWAIEICPDLEEIPECFPCDGIENRTNHALSWPLYQRIGGTVHACRAYAMLPSPHDAGMQEVDPTNLEALARLITDAVTPAALVEEFATVLDEREKLQSCEQDENELTGGVIGIKPKPITQVQSDRDLAKQVIADFNRTHRIEDMVELNKKHKFPATWRGERTPSVALDRSGEYATDYGKNGSFPKKLDAYEVYCLVNSIDKKADLAERCAQLRRAEIKIVKPVEPATELFPVKQTEQKPQGPVYAICPICSTPKSVKRADGVMTCGTDHVG